MITGLSHVSIVVPDLDAAARTLDTRYGLKIGTIQVNAEQGVRMAYVELANAKIELMEPSRADSPVAKFLEKNGEGIHHVAFATTDIAGQLQLAAGGGVKLIHEQPFEGAAGKLVAFLHPKSTYGVLTEFCMEKSS